MTSAYLLSHQWFFELFFKRMLNQRSALDMFIIITHDYCSNAKIYAKSKFPVEFKSFNEILVTSYN